ncbi:MAG: pantoate--beta-alanine ligase [Pseudomonadota bacterium]
MQVIQSLAVMREQIDEWRIGGERIVLVPTMGNLHDGHLALVRHAKSLADRVVVSIFVNPTQFGVGEDFGSYPRTLQDDCQALMAAGAHLVFTPDERTMYPLGTQGATHIHVPGVSTKLDGKHRPGHFDGVATVVCRLFAMVAPDVAVFGQKDFQQVLVIRQMVRDLSLPIAVATAPTVRAEDGLALSSRNQYLDEHQRLLAPMLFTQLSRIAERLTAGARDYKALRAEALASLEESGFLPDYIAIRDPVTLKKSQEKDHNWVVLGAATLGRTRLIDNIIASASL